MYLSKFEGNYLPTTCLVGDELVIGVRGSRYWYTRPQHLQIGLSTSLFMRTDTGEYIRVFPLNIIRPRLQGYDLLHCIELQYGPAAVGVGLVEWEEIRGAWRNFALGRRKYRAVAVKS